eukprot:m.170249 g.170249  ORF g.170249 m.170249 type:complete len:95 (+) comp13216_c0_seq1:33-317(+)
MGWQWASARTARAGARLVAPRRAGSSSAPKTGPEPPNGFLFGEPPSGVRKKGAFEAPMEVLFGGIVLFTVAWNMRPDHTPRAWARDVVTGQDGK